MLELGFSVFGQIKAFKVFFGREASVYGTIFAPVTKSDILCA